MTGRTAYVRRRPNRNSTKKHAMRGVIYLPASWTGTKVKVVANGKWESFKKRLRIAETKLRQIERTVKC